LLNKLLRKRLNHELGIANLHIYCISSRCLLIKSYLFM